MLMVKIGGMLIYARLTPD